MRLATTAAFLLYFVSSAMSAERLEMRTVNEAKLPSQPSEGTLSPAVIKAQVLLDRAHFSPGEIDGKAGENFLKALTAFEAERGLPGTKSLDEEVWQELNSVSSNPVLMEYTLTEADVRGPFVPKLPREMDRMKDLPSLGYRTSAEKLAEKFHISEELLSALNPDASLETAGTSIVVANPALDHLDGKIVRLEVDKTRQTLKAFDRAGKLLAYYPATVGSTEKPAPSGRLTVRTITKNPNYRYNPDYAFKGVHSTKPFTIKPGPNNPVGLVWIGLSPGQGYGIHGTPDPSKVSKSESHGCVRLTNWDALRLAFSLAKGAVVDFYGDEQARQHRGTATKNKR